MVKQLSNESGERPEVSISYEVKQPLGADVMSAVLNLIPLLETAGIPVPQGRSVIACYEMSGKDRGELRVTVRHTSGAGAA